MAITSFIPTIWSARLLTNLEKNHIATNVVNTDYTGEITGVGSKVKINTLSAIAVRPYTKGTPITVDALTTVDTDLDIDQANYFAFGVEDIDAVQAAGDVVDTATAKAAYSLVDASDAYILATIATAAKANSNVIGTASAPIALTAANIYSYIVSMRKELDKKGVPTEGRSLVVSPDVYAILLQSTQFIALNADVAADAVVNGLVGRIAGFDVYESANAVENTTGTKYSMVTAQHKDATAFAEQIVKTEALRDSDQFQDIVRGLNVFGCAVVSKDAIVGMYAAL